MPEAKYILDQDQVDEIRRALMIGLASFGEIERLTDTYTLLGLGDDKLPEELSPIHPTGASDTVSLFASAMLTIEYLKAEPGSTQAQVAI